MAFVFKPIEPSHITVTPFYANKLWSIGSTTIADLTDPGDNYVDSEVSMSIYYGRYHTSSWITTASEETTTHGEYSRIIWDSVYNMFYRDFQRKPFEYYKQGNVGVETRNITETIQVFSIPQKIIGAGIMPGSFKLTKGSGTYIDDGNGNIIGPDLTYYTNPILENFHYCSYLFTDAYIGNTVLEAGVTPDNTSPMNTFYTYNHGNIGNKPNYNYTSSLGVAAPVHGPSILQAQVNNAVIGKYALGSTYYIDLYPYDYNGPSRYIRIPHSEKLNFSENQDFSIVVTTNLVGSAGNDIQCILGKYGRERVRTAPWSPSNRQFTDPDTFDNIQFGGEVYEDRILTGQYPYKLEVNTFNGDLTFSISDGSKVSTVTAAGWAQFSTWSTIACIKSGSNLSIYVDGSIRATNSITCSGAIRNNSDIFVGCSGNDIVDSNVQNSPSQLYGQIGTVHFFDRGLNDTELDRLYNDMTVETWYSANNRYGNIIYNQGLVVWTNGRSANGATTPGDFATTNVSFDSMQFRSTKLINSNEVICVSGPNEHTMTSNPTILVKKNGTCNPGIGSDEIGFYNNDGECYSFVTGSDFSPYITGVGLYNEAGELLVVGKLAAPIKKPTNCDTVFVVRWDS